MMKEMLSTHLFELQDSHSVFWWVTASANRTFVCLQEKLLGASFDAVRWKMFFDLFRLKSFKTFSILDFFWFDIPACVSVNSLSFRTEQVVIFFETLRLAKTSQWPWICGIIMSVQVFLPSNQSESSDRWNVQSPRFLCADSPSSRRHYERWQGGMWFSSLQSTQSLRILFYFFFLVTQISDNFFPSCRSALSSSGSATYYLHPETQLRPKVSQTEREQESLTERIRGENSQSCMNEGLKMTQKNCFPCLPWVILSEQLSAFSSRWLSPRNKSLVFDIYPSRILRSIVACMSQRFKRAVFCPQVLSVQQVFRTVEQPAANWSQGRPPQGRDGGGSQPHGDLSSQSSPSAVRTQPFISTTLIIISDIICTANHII